MLSYKQRHEQFVADNPGQPATEVFFCIAPSVLLMLISSSVLSLVVLDSPWWRFLLEMAIVCLPQLLIVTVLGDHQLFVAISELLLTLGLVLYFTGCSWKRLRSFSVLKAEKRPLITNLRACISHISCIAILAVDFGVFPRRFAKTETYGYSLMDTGVGLYIASNSLVGPEMHNAKAVPIRKAIQGCVPLLVLGAGRLFATREVDYQVHVSEYGVHWNFFVTLAFVKLSSALLINAFGVHRSEILAAAVFLVHETTLQLGLADWVLGDAPRDTFLAANREGIVSSLGYLGLYLSGLSFSKAVNLQCQVYDRHDLQKMLRKLMRGAIVFFVGTQVCERNFGVSRRLANVGYGCWIGFITHMVGLAFVLAYILARNFAHAYRPKNFVYAPIIFEAMNYNGLFYFLLANILTGLVNISIQTIYVGNVAALIILLTYKTVCCSILTYLYRNGIKLKKW